MIGMALGVLLFASPPAEAQRSQLATLLEAEAQALTTQADRLEKAGKGAVAKVVRDLIERPPPIDGPWRFVPLPEYVTAESLAADPPGGEDVQAIRQSTAAELARLATRALEPKIGRYGLATECLRSVLQRDPGNAEARRLLGYVAHQGGWATPQARLDREAGKVLDPTFGWVPADWRPHLEAGELPAPGRPGAAPAWLPAAQADELRRDIARGWVITTEHFAVRTNVPLAEAITFGRRLEAVRECFFTLFADVIGPAQLPLAERSREAQLGAEPPKRRHEVWYFADRDEYLAFFRRLGKDERVSLGYYMPKDEANALTLDGRSLPPRSYFFRDLNGSLGAEATLFHEASHQVLFESAGPSSFQRNVGNYWVWEGLGTYFETFTPRPDGAYEIGGRVGPRLEQARSQARRFVPIARLTALDKTAFYRDEDQARFYYAESMAMVVFLMHAENARYRAAFLDYVADAYRGRFRPGGAARPLAERLEDTRDLDAKLVRFVTSREPD